MLFSLIIPVYNRPEEVQELLESISNQDFKQSFEVVIVEDGSSILCQSIVELFSDKLDITYFFKENSGPGDSRNFGMKNAKGDYYLIFDSDCILPNHYLTTVQKSLAQEYVDCFGGPDKALRSFSSIQKAINFSMTSFLTTGGVRGGSEKINQFQPRSFNMGISKKAYQASGGFGNIHPGEDPDLSIRLWQLGFKTKLITEAYVYHKRRIDWNKFYVQVSKFGKARPILNSWYPDYAKPTYFFPTLFILGLDLALIIMLFGFFIPILGYAFYFILLFLISLISNKSVKIASLSVVATAIQFYGYGLGFLKSFITIQVLKREPQKQFPELFYTIK